MAGGKRQKAEMRSDLIGPAIGEPGVRSQKSKAKVENPLKAVASGEYHSSLFSCDFEFRFFCWLLRVSNFEFRLSFSVQSNPSTELDLTPVSGVLSPDSHGRGQKSRQPLINNTI